MTATIGTVVVVIFILVSLAALLAALHEVLHAWRYSDEERLDERLHK